MAIRTVRKDLGAPRLRPGPVDRECRDRGRRPRVGAMRGHIPADPPRGHRGADNPRMIAAVVLAAGAASRFGAPKQELLLPGVLERVGASSVQRVVVVLGAHPDRRGRRRGGSMPRLGARSGGVAALRPRGARARGGGGRRLPRRRAAALAPRRSTESSTPGGAAPASFWRRATRRQRASGRHRTLSLGRHPRRRRAIASAGSRAVRRSGRPG